MNTALNISSSPHARDKWTTAFIMRIVALSLMPVTLVGIFNYGMHAFLVVLVSVVAAVASEFAFDKLCHKPDTWKDGSAVVTGLMLALTLSPTVPLHLPILGSLFAILVVKCCFGGLGKNFLNPALAARCFLLISFGSSMSSYTADAISSATPVAMLRAGEAVNITRMFLGTDTGVIGSSVLALLVGGLALWAMDIIHGEICFSVLGMFTLIIGLFGGQGFDPKFLLAHICGGGVVMGAFFMATDYATSPVSRLGQMIYGMLIGLLGALFRLFGSAADSFSYSVIAGNLFVPMIDMYIVSKPFAYRRAALARQRGAVAEGPWYRRIPRPVIVLTAIAAIAGLALSGVYAMTKDTIDNQKRAAQAASYLVVCPEAESFEVSPEIDQAIADLDGAVYGTDFGRVHINEGYAAVDADGNNVGHVISVTSSDAFDGDLTLAVGLDAEGSVNAIAFTELNETPGMGMRVDDPEFKDQFAGKSVDKFTLNKAGGSTADDQIDTVSGASTTSGAVVNAVNAALDFFHSVVKGGN